MLVVGLLWRGKALRFVDCIGFGKVRFQRAKVADKITRRLQENSKRQICLESKV